MRRDMRICCGNESLHLSSWAEADDINFDPRREGILHIHRHRVSRICSTTEALCALGAVTMGKRTVSSVSFGVERR